MNRIKLYAVLFIFAISSLFVVKGIYGYFTVETEPKVNALSIEKNTSYTVVHELMNIDGTTYTEHSRTHYAEVPLGQEVTPAVLSLEGFTSPATQTVTLNSFNDTVITYRYTRNQYTLTINNSTHVTTSTPSGTYYYGQEIHLIADQDDGNGAPFVKWSDNQTNPDYTFILTGNKTVGPVYANTFTITYITNNDPNDPNASITDEVIEHDPITTFPDIDYNDCDSGTGTYQELNCTYVYEFLGWYRESTFVNKVDETFVPTADTTLYAKWNKIYFHNDLTVFDGSNYLDTKIALFSTENANKDFIVTFSYDAQGTGGGDPQLLFTDLREGLSPYAGVSFKYMKANDRYDLVANVATGDNTVGGKMTTTLNGFGVGDDVVLKRENGKFYYSIDGGDNFTFLNDFSNFNLYFDVYAVFGAGYSNVNTSIYRYFKGTLSNMTVELKNRASYTITFNANGGTGVMADQIIELGQNTNLSPNNFTNDDATFDGWNTEPDGSGTSYPNNYPITSDLGNDGDVITLYAQWIPAQHYFVHFDANGGTGTMADQRFTIGNTAVPLTANAFSRTNYEFRGWNTAADGSGTHYDDEQAVANLSQNNNATVTLYAEWWKIQYIHTGDAVFDGTQNTFIDTGVNVFSNSNINKDFEIRLTFKGVDSDQSTYTPKQPTILNVKDESNTKAPGFNLRFQNTNSITSVTVTGKWTNNSGNAPAITSVETNKAPIDFIFSRKNGVITVKYIYNNTESQEYTVLDQSNWTLNQPFATNVAFGGYFDGNNQPGRFFKGVLADMIILMDD